jgi:hypothetical protein
MPVRRHTDLPSRRDRFQTRRCGNAPAPDAGVPHGVHPARYGHPARNRVRKHVKSPALRTGGVVL